jgi:hypothetical protein
MVACAFRGFHPWSLDLMAFASTVKWKIMAEVHGGARLPDNKVRK